MYKICLYCEKYCQFWDDICTYKLKCDFKDMEEKQKRVVKEKQNEVLFDN